jgi:hypothetical protein
VSDDAGTTEAAWLEAVRRDERRGELLDAVDVAERGLAEHPESLWLRHRQVLALARAGATDRAAGLYVDYVLDASQEEDVAALGARLAKDLALAATGTERRRLALRTRDRYAAIHARRASYYPAINAATASLVGGDDASARALAAEALRLADAERPQTYFAAATAAEAHLLLEDAERAAAALARCADLSDDDHGALSTTRRQLRLVCELRGIDPAILAPLAGPAVVHFCGHRIAAPGEDGRFPAAAEAAVAAEVRRVVADHRPGFAYGALASGADILFAEALLDAGTELHVVLPFERGEFVATSVASSGPEWVERFDACLAAATRVTYATSDAFLGDDVLFRYGAQLAMGLALLRAGHLDADVVQLAVWDEAPALGAAGTAIDVGTWQGRGLPTVVVGTGAGSSGVPAEASPSAPPAGGGRVLRSLLFADVKGFSRLTDEQLPRFATEVLGAFSAVLGRFGDEVLHRNTWGDALYVVIEHPARAAECALALQEAMGAIDLESLGLPPGLALRLGAHLGPVFPTHDPVLDELVFMGSHVSRTARIEPVTPPSEVYVTEAFAAGLELLGNRRYACDYVGHMPTAKDYGRLRMYRLRRA